MFTSIATFLRVIRIFVKSGRHPEVSEFKTEHSHHFPNSRNSQKFSNSHRHVFLLFSPKHQIAIPTPFSSVIRSACPVDEDGKRFFLSDHLGRLYILFIEREGERVTGLRLELIGTVSDFSIIFIYEPVNFSPEGCIVKKHEPVWDLNARCGYVLFFFFLEEFLLQCNCNLNRYTIHPVSLAHAQASPAECMAYLDSGCVFLGSVFTDSMLVRSGQRMNDGFFFGFTQCALCK